MRRARVGGFRRRAPADAAAGDPFWDGAEPADVVCVVCQEDVTPRDSAAGNVRWLDCGHFGHRECFDPWIARARECPECRQPVVDGAARWHRVAEPAAAAAAERDELRFLRKPPPKTGGRQPDAFRYASRGSLLALNAVAVVAHATCAVLGQFVLRRGDPSVTLVAPLVEFNVNPPPGTPIFSPTPRSIWTYSLLWPSVAVEYITCGFHVVYFAALYSGSVDAFVRTYIADTGSANALRWVEYAVTATIMSAFGAPAIGIVDWYNFLRTVASGVGLQMCGYVIELLDHERARDRRLFAIVWWLGSVLNLFGVFILIFQTFASSTHQTLFYWNAAFFAVWFQTFGILANLAFRRYRQCADPYFVERWYILLSLSTKLAVFWLSFASYRYIVESNDWAPATPGVNWTAVRYCAAALPLAWVGAAAAYDAAAWGAARARERCTEEGPGVKLVAAWTELSM